MALKYRPHPNELRDIASALRRLREYPAATRHPEIDNPLREAELWAQTEYDKITEERPELKGKTFTIARLIS